MVLTKYSDRIDIPPVKIEIHIIDSHIEISGASSSFDVSSLKLLS
jgi:hypothetical protein